ncbi:MAG: dTDP-4-dehydrorhamnose 3,5-epimerase family protein [Candidatus Doudnabacteria bacterium]|nr:dTDP-4-dehydrorhamnose 3,5-epimerase family protein [Candidatus Doudnabacteria bacterium]
MVKVTEYEIKDTTIPGLLEIDVSIVEDSRGYFQEKFQKQKLVEKGFRQEFNPIQHNISYNKEIGVTRGFHSEPWDKYVSVVKGKVYAVYVDLRKENFGKIFALTIDATKAVFVPRGVANSFQTLEPDTYYTYLTNSHWAPDQSHLYKFINLSDPDLAVKWSVPLDKCLISEKDLSLPFLKDVTPFEI